MMRPPKLLLILLASLVAVPLCAVGQREKPSLTGIVEVVGSEPHTQGLIRLDDGRVCLVEPGQWAERKLSTGRFAFRLEFLPARKPLPGLVPPHDAVVRVLEAAELAD